MSVKALSRNSANTVGPKAATIISSAKPFKE